MHTFRWSSEPVVPRLPSAGPLILLIPGVSDTTIVASTTGPLTTYRWPRPLLVSALWLGEQNTATAAAVANLHFRMLDARGKEMIITGTNTGINTSGSLSFGGISPRWVAFRRVIRAGDKWQFQIENRNAFDVVPQLYFKLEEQ